MAVWIFLSFFWGEGSFSPNDEDYFLHPVAFFFCSIPHQRMAQTDTAVKIFTFLFLFILTDPLVQY